MSKPFLRQVLKTALMSSMLAAAAFAAQAQAMRGGGDPGLDLLFGAGHRIERMLESVDATAAQIVQAAMPDMKAQREAGRQLHEQGLALFAAPVVDANAVEVLRQQMSVQHPRLASEPACSPRSPTPFVIAGLCLRLIGTAPRALPPMRSHKT